MESMQGWNKGKREKETVGAKAEEGQETTGKHGGVTTTSKGGENFPTKCKYLRVLYISASFFHQEPAG